MRFITKCGTSPINPVDANKALKKVFDSILAGTLKSTDFDRAVYGSPAVKTQLLQDQHNKCAFCEKNILDDIRDVEHFKPKTECQQQKGSPVFRGYWWLAFDWTNLVYCCKVCNESYKKNYFPLANAHSSNPSPSSEKTEDPLLINPTRDNPVDFIVFDKNRIYANNNSLKGQTTINVLGLNRRSLEERERLDRWKEFRTMYKLFQKINPSDPEYTQTKQEIHDLFFDDNCEYVGMFENQQTPIVL